MKNILIFLLLVWLPLSLSAANHYVRAGATGTADGSDWTNACTAFTGSCLPTSLIRGDTYYVAGGSYAAVTFNEPVSGALVITIKGAIASDHGTETGWQASYGVDVTQAAFPGGLGFRTAYWTVDGQVGSGKVAASYGFKIGPVASCTGTERYLLMGGDSSDVVTNLTIKYVHVETSGPSCDVAKVIINQGFSLADQGNSLFSHIYARYMTSILSDGFSYLGPDTYEYIYSEDAFSSPTAHGALFAIRGQAGASGSIIRYSIFSDCIGTACVEAIGGTVGNQFCAIDGWKIHGNVFANATTGNGVLGAGSYSLFCNTEVYHNTFVNTVGSQGIFQNGINCTTGCALGVNNTVKNNLVYNGNAGIVDYTGLGITHDYNAFFVTTSTPTEDNGQIDAVTNPLTNASGGNYHLLIATNAAEAAGCASYPTDLDGITRGSSGVCDRGAYEFLVSGTAQYCCLAFLNWPWDLNEQPVWARKREWIN